MHDAVIEKRLVWLFVLSLAAHIALFLVIQRFTSVTQAPRQEPVYIDLQDIPQPPRPPRPVVPPAGQRFSRPASPARPVLPSIGIPKPRTVAPTVQPESAAPRSEPPVASGESISSLLRRKPAELPPSATRPNLAPNTRALARLEEGYRRKFEKEIEEGTTQLLDSEDLRFTSFLRRFETAVYGVWTYPQDAIKNGMEGVTPVRITFNRSGAITDIQLMESSGYRILDEEVVRTLKAVGAVGALPRGYTKEEFHVLAFFQYGRFRRSLR